MTSVQKATLFAATVMVTAMIILPPSVWSDTVGLLNTFHADETARAADVNDNFDAVEDAVDGNDALIAALEARIEALEALEGVPGPQGEQGPQGETGADGRDTAVLHVFDGDGNDIGLYAGKSDSRGAERVDGLVWVYLDEYEAVAQFNIADGVMREFSQPQFFFQSVDCSGPAFIGIAVTIIRPNIFDNSVYVVTGSVSETIMIQSRAALPFQSSESRCELTGQVSLRLVSVTEIEPVPDLVGPLYVAPVMAAAP